MSDSVQPHIQQATRLPCPWDSPGKNTGVGCHFLLQFMKGKRESKVAQPCETLSNPKDCSLPDSSVHGIFQARVLEWVAIAFSESLHGVRYIATLNKNKHQPKILVGLILTPTNIFSIFYLVYILTDLCSIYIIICSRYHRCTYFFYYFIVQIWHLLKQCT